MRHDHEEETFLLSHSNLFFSTLSTTSQAPSGYFKEKEDISVADTSKTACHTKTIQMDKQHNKWEEKHGFQLRITSWRWSLNSFQNSQYDMSVALAKRQN